MVVASRDRVDAWSVRRLPFEPKGSMISLRAALRSALDDLEPGVDGALRAVYSTASMDFCDAENVLLYNVGPSRFTRLATRHLSFERSSVVPACPHPLSGPALHHHSYMTACEPGFNHWDVEGVLAYGTASMPSRSDKPADWWWRVRLGSRTESGSLPLGQPFGLRVQLCSPSTSIAATLKPMLDGLIASLQSDPAPSNEAVARLADHLKVEPAVVQAHLTSRGPLEGRAPLVRDYREGLQWNPVDDLCAASTVEHISAGGTREIRWELLDLAPRVT
jgi:hypothetical protein